MCAAVRCLAYLFIALFPVCQTLAIQEVPAHQTFYEIESQKNIDQVLFLMQKRLALMHEVARTKWNQNLPIEDLSREQQLINALTIKAKSCGLEEAWTRKFFQAQFDAAKLIQKNDFSYWSKQQHARKFDSVLDLKTEIRPHLDHLSDELLNSLTKIYPEITTGKLSPHVLTLPLSRRITDVVDESVWMVAILPLLRPHDGS